MFRVHLAHRQDTDVRSEREFTVADRGVVLFTANACPDSPRVRDWLRQHGLHFTERSLDDDPAAVEDLVQTGLFVTPLLLAGDQRVVGFRPQRLKELFDVE